MLKHDFECKRCGKPVQLERAFPESTIIEYCSSCIQPKEKITAKQICKNIRPEGYSPYRQLVKAVIPDAEQEGL